ncbi:MAG: sulfite exporter TauE/SafE family protein [Dermabacter sp.]|nr:sulfite exporter TauE/SafE family protein [Dermabacter sp.]
MIALALVIGVGIGIVVGALGAGGGILSVPVLVYLIGMEPHDATAASLVIVAVTALVSLRHPAKNGNVAWREGFVFAAFALVSSAIASRLSLFVPSHLLMVLFAVLLLSVGVMMARRGRTTLRAERPHPVVDDPMATARPASTASPARSRVRSLLPLILAATATGTLTGFFGVGGGFLAVPMLVIALGLPIRKAAGTSLLVMIMTALAALLARIGTPTHIDWPVVLLFVLGSSVGGLIGGPLSARAKPSTLTFLFAALLFVLGIVTLATSVF